MKKVLIGIIFVLMLAMNVEAEECEPKFVEKFESNIILKSDGTLWWFGYTNPFTDESIVVEEPFNEALFWEKYFTVHYSGIDNVKAVNGNYFLKNDGSVWAFGDNSFGKLGVGETKPRKSGTIYHINPTQMSGLPKIVQIGDCFALDSDGVIWKWGKENEFPHKVKNLSKIVEVLSDDKILDENGEVWCVITDPLMDEDFEKISHVFLNDSGNMVIYNGSRLYDIDTLKQEIPGPKLKKICDYYLAIDENDRLVRWEYDSKFLGKGSIITGYHIESVVETDVYNAFYDGNVIIKTDGSLLWNPERIKIILKKDLFAERTFSDYVNIKFNVNEKQNYNSETENSQTSTENGTNDDIVVKLNGYKIEFSNAQPQIIDGRTLVPMRDIFETFGMNVKWKAETKTVIASNSDTSIKLTVGNNIADINNNSVTIDVVPQIIDGSTMVPLRFIGESLGCKVDWNGEEKVVDITK